MSKCSETQERIEELIRGELCAEDSAAIRAHLDGCTACRDEREVCERLTEAVKRSCSEPAPPSLRQAIEESLRNLHATE